MARSISELPRRPPKRVGDRLMLGPGIVLMGSSTKMAMGTPAFCVGHTSSNNPCSIALLAYRQVGLGSHTMTNWKFQHEVSA